MSSPIWLPRYVAGPLLLAIRNLLPAVEESESVSDGADVWSECFVLGPTVFDEADVASLGSFLLQVDIRTKRRNLTILHSLDYI